MSYGKPLPEPDAASQPFWDGCRSHRLLMQRCAACGTLRFPPGPRCPACRSPAAEWIEACGRGTVFSWIVVDHPVPREAYGDEVPYAVALVELAEGVRMPTNIVGIAPGEITPGMPVEVTFDDVTPAVTLPRFRPLGPSE